MRRWCESQVGDFHSRSIVGIPFLVGFEKVRVADGETFLAGDGKWEEDLYRHPTRQGLWPEQEYSMQHDIYSLGVLLLEIGLWTSFVHRVDPAFEQRLLAGTDIPRFSGAVPGPMLPILTFLAEKNQRKKAAQIKQVLLDLAQKELPRALGHRYADIVVSCLTCLDNPSPRFGDPQDFFDEDGILIGVRFVENIIVKIQEIAL
jgi:hypothetical protein